MRISRTIVAALLVMNILATPQIAVKAIEADLIRATVIDPALSDAFAAEGSAGEQSVMLWIDDIEHPTTIAQDLAATAQTATVSLQSTDAAEGSTQEEIAEIQSLISKKRAQSRKLYEAHNTAFAEQNLNEEDIVYISRYSPVIITSLNQAQVNLLALNEQVTDIALYAPSNAVTIAEADVEETITADASNAETTPTNYKQMIRASGSATNLYSGEGIKVGVFEASVPSEEYQTTNNVIECFSRDGTFYEDEKTVTHVNMVTSIIKSIAPNIELYCAAPTADDSLENDYILPIEMLLTADVNIINMSCLVGTDGNNTYGISAKWLDHIITQHYVTVVKTPGNLGSGLVNSGAMSYNSIVVGAVNADGSHRPSSSYNHITSGVLSRPDICAPGENINAAGVTDSGTSFAAPQVTGAIALICEQKSELLAFPETVKAILTAGVNRSYDTYTTIPYTNDNLFCKYGAGILDCTRNYQLVRAGNYYNGYLPPSGSTEHTLTTASIGGGVTVRVSLSYSKYTSYGSNCSSGLESDLTQGTLPDIELTISGNGQSATTRAANNQGANLKITSITGNSQGTYTIRIQVDNASDQETFYGVAWSVG